MPHGFAPIARADARVLILGTMPSAASLRCAQYYGHSQNAFWKIIFGLWDKEVPQDYQRKTEFSIEKRIALWDVLNACERSGSADAKIKNPVPNDFCGLIEECPDIQAVFFNSHNAAAFYKRLVIPDAFVTAEKFILPSTSPACAMKFEKKRELWMPVHDYLENDPLS